MKTAVTQNGRVSKSVNVATSAPGAEKLRLRFTVNVRMPIEVKPSFRFVVNTVEGKSASDRVLLSRSDGEDLVVSGVEVPLKGVSVAAEPVPPPNASREGEAPAPRLGSPDGAEPGDVWLEMEVAPTLAPGRYSNAVRLATNDSDAPELKIPFTIRIRPLIEARPSVVRMWSAPNAEDPGRSVIVALNHYGDRKFAVTSVEVSHPEIFTGAAYGKEPSTQQSVRTGLVEGFDAAAIGTGVEGWIRIATDDPDRPLIEVPVLVAPSRASSRR